MGGRSKVREYSGLPDRFMWLKDVSDGRLDRYGKAGQTRHLQGSEDPSRKTGYFSSVWDYAAIEYKERHGVEPEWSPRFTSINGSPSLPSSLPPNSPSIASFGKLKASSLSKYSHGELLSMSESARLAIDQERSSGESRTRGLRVRNAERKLEAIQRVIAKKESI